MSYAEILTHRMAYDIDGTAVAYNTQSYAAGATTWLSSTQMGNLNKDWPVVTVVSPPYTNYLFLYFFFPERREVSYFYISSNYNNSTSSETLYLVSLYGSNDTTNGADGTWEAATFPEGKPAVFDPVLSSWRSGLKVVSFPDSYKTLRLQCYGGEWDGNVRYTFLNQVHIYGKKAFGQTPDDILFVDTSGEEIVKLKDWGDTPEGTTQFSTFRLKNASTSKIANNINIQLTDTYMAISFNSDGPWTNVLDIASLSPGTMSQTIYVRNQLPPPLIPLGPRSARVIVTVGSWT